VLNLPDPAAIASVPQADLPATLTHLAALQTAIAARLADGPGEVRNGSAPAPPPTEQGALTQEDAARSYHIPLRTLRRLTRTRRVPSYLLGRNRMIRPADLDTYLARCRAQGVKVGTILDV
jgi:excisionase family DNA binding protein